MSKYLLPILLGFACCVIIITPSFAQKLPSEKPVGLAELPPWAQLMYSERPNVWEVDRAYSAWFREHPFVKTAHTQYYKKWRRLVENRTDADGFVLERSLEEVRREQRTYLNLIEQQNHLSRNTPEWNCLGPFDTYSEETPSLRVSWQANVYTIDQSQSNPEIVYCGTENGGVFRSNDKGLNWEPASFTSLIGTVRSVKVHPTNPETVYAGDGRFLYKTVDGGLNWATVYEQNNLNVNDIAINPANPNVLLVAADAGLFRSENAGQTWSALYTAKCWDLEIKPNDPTVVYLLKNNSAQKRCEFFKSSDSGASFSIRESGWYSSANADRRDDGARMTVTPADANAVYVVLAGDSKPGDNGFIGVFRSMDAGETWNLPNPPVGGPYTASHPNLMTLNNTNTLYQGYYNLGIAAAHTNANQVLIGGLNLWSTTDGAQTFTPLGGYQGNVGWIHPDQQEIEINGNDMWVANDGGINYSTNLFNTHESRKNGLIASEFWGFGSGWNDDLLVGGRYHNGNTAHRNGFEQGQFLRLGGAEAPTGYVNPGGKNIAYFSDIDSRIVPNSFTEQVRRLPQLALYPNESYFAAHSGELEFHPYCYNVIYVGRENKLWRSDNGGQAFFLVKAFGEDPDSPLLHFEISRSNPDVIYVYQRTSFAGATLWKTSNGGATWASKTFPSANSQRAGTMALSAEDENTLWVAFGHQNNDGAKIYKTTNGGDSWENWTTPSLNGQSIQAILHQAGTDGGVYIGTNYAVFYRDNSLNDWILYNSNLPTRTDANIFRPFYKENKLRLATYSNGLWECDFSVPSAPLAQPTVDKLFSSCTRDTFYFDDYSILQHAGATWSWSFPGAAYVSSTTERAPKVVYNQPGVYDVALQITDGSGQISSKSIPQMITVTNACAPDGIPGYALSCNETGDYAQTFDFEQSTNQLTISAWIKPDGIQPDYSGIVMNDAIAGFNFKSGNNMLGYHWPNGGQWWWNSNLLVSPDEWSHVAMVVTPESVTLYLNGVGATQNISLPPALLSTFKFGSYNAWESRNFKGLMDEVTIWNRSLTQEEIRELRHLTKIPADDPSLIAYYQFNEPAGQALDRSGVRHAELTGGATRVTSTAPLGHGVSKRLDLNTGGDFEFEGTGFGISFQNDLPSGEVVATRINLSPDVFPETGAFSRSYWVLNNYGANPLFSEPLSLRFDQIGVVSQSEETDPSRLKLFIRVENGEGDTWLEQAAATSAVAGADGAATFGEGNAVEFLGQYLIGIDTNQIVSIYENEELLPEPVLLFPNILTPGSTVNIRTQIPGNYTFHLLDASGRSIFRQKDLSGTVRIHLPPNLQSGIYAYRMEWPAHLFGGKLIVIEK